MTRKSLIEQFAKSPPTLEPKSIVKRHQEEIKKLITDGYFLRDIHKKILEIYQEDIEAGELKLSEANFYKIWSKLNTKKKEIIREKNTAATEPKDRKWDNTSNADNPFLKKK